MTSPYIIIHMLWDLNKNSIITRPVHRGGVIGVDKSPLLLSLIINYLYLFSLIRGWQRKPFNGVKFPMSQWSMSDTWVICLTCFTKCTWSHLHLPILFAGKPKLWKEVKTQRNMTSELFSPKEEHWKKIMSQVKAWS